MGSPQTGEIYEGNRRSELDVALNAKQAAELREMDVDHRKDVLAKMKELEDQMRTKSAIDSPTDLRWKPEQDISPGTEPEFNPQPDLRTLEGAKRFLDYHAPDADTLPRHNQVNAHFQTLIELLWPVLPGGPGKTVALRAIGDARMACNSVIANHGA